MMQPKTCRPYGDPVASDLWFIGHDPRLRKSDAEAGTCFFLDLLDQPPSRQAGEKQKRALAQGVLDYVERLAGRPVRAPQLYVTNLCNEFLPPTKQGVVLIPDEVGDRGVRAINDALATRSSPPRVMVPTSQQVLYHLVRSGFLGTHPDLERFADASKPKETAAGAGAYEPTRGEAFVAVCGRVFDGPGFPVVPVLHISAWRRPTLSPKYDEPMKNAMAAVRRLLA